MTVPATWGTELHDTYLTSAGVRRSGPGSGQDHLLITPRYSAAADSQHEAIIMGTPVKAPIGMDGTFSIILPPTDDPDLNPTNFTYQVREMWPGGRIFDIALPTALGPSVALRDVAPAEIVEGISLSKGDTGATPDISIGTVVAGATGDPAAATMTGTPENPILGLVLPRGATGAQGIKGDTGATGAGLASHLADADPHPQYPLKAAANTFTAAQTISAAAAQVAIIRPAAPADSRRWDLAVETAGTFTATPKSDVGAANGTALTITRAGVIMRGGIYEITGTGDPNGVHTAPVGSAFRNVEAGGYNGARVWRKDTGSGSTGWVVESGDTGWLDASPRLSADWDLTAPGAAECRVRRVGNSVEYSIRARRTVATGLRSGLTAIIAALPIGFGARSYTPTGLGVVSLVGETRLAATGGFSTLLDVSIQSAGTGTWAIGDTISISGTYSTVHAWPTTLTL